VNVGETKEEAAAKANIYVLRDIQELETKLQALKAQLVVP
jgi:hypothetical protein